MKFLIVTLCLVQVAFGAPDKSVLDQAQETITNFQREAQAAIQNLNAKVLETTGVRSNQELVQTVQTRAETYATQIKGVADQINTQAAENKVQVDSTIQNIAKQLSDSAAKILGNDDPTKVSQLQATFGNVLEQANTLNARLQTEGASIQSIFADTLSKLYENTIANANSLAQQFDAQKSP